MDHASAARLAAEPNVRPRLLDQVRHAIRVRHYSIRTEEAYVGWIRRYVFFHHKRHPAELGPADIGRFLTALAVERHVSASTQNQALAALLFLFRHVFGRQMTPVEGVVRAKTGRRLARGPLARRGPCAAPASTSLPRRTRCGTPTRTGGPRT
jgi:hypothetical protein